MLMCVRTTINLPDALVAEAKARALAEGRTFTSLIAEGLRTVLQGPVDDEPMEPLPAFGDPEGSFLIDPADREALWAALDADGPR